MSWFDYDFETKAVNFSSGMPEESGDVHRPCTVDLEITCSAHFLLVEPHETDPRLKKAVASVSLKISNSVCIKPHHQSETSTKILRGIVETWPLHPGEERTKLVNRIHSLLRRYTYAKKTSVGAIVNVEIINTHLLHESSVFHRILALSPERRRIEEEEEDEITDRCSICLNVFSKRTQVSIMPCSHMFHCNCIEQWLMKRRSCPLCRFQMTMGVIFKCSTSLMNVRS